MISWALLFWVGIQLDAPLWYWVLMGIGAFLSILNFGLKMYKAGNK